MEPGGTTPRLSCRRNAGAEDKRSQGRPHSPEVGMGMYPSREGTGNWFFSKAGEVGTVEGDVAGWVLAVSGAVPSQLPSFYPRAYPNLSSAFLLSDWFSLCCSREALQAFLC